MSNSSNGSKQTPGTARKARELLKLRRNNITWERAAKEVGIVKDNGDPDPGLAYKIAIEGYEPKGQEVRDRLGLKKICTSCMRGFRSISRQISALSPWRAWWNRLKPGERDRWIRKNYEEGNK
jgi:hypothetical protein